MAALVSFVLNVRTLFSQINKPFSIKRVFFFSIFLQNLRLMLHFGAKLFAALLSKPYGYDSYPFTFKVHQRANLPQNQGRSLRYRTAERLIKNSWSLRVLSRKRKRPRKLCSNELNVKKTRKKWSPIILKCRTYHLMNCEYLHGWDAALFFMVMSFLSVERFLFERLKSSICICIYLFATRLPITKKCQKKK